MSVIVNGNNLCIFEGRLVRDPQISSVQINGQNVDKALFTIAVERALSSNQRQKAKTDSSVKTVDFVPCSLLGAGVSVLSNFFSQGKAIKVVGHYTEWQSTDPQTGQKKYGHIFEVDTINFVVQDSKNSQQNSGNANNNQQYTPQNSNNNQQYAPQNPNNNTSPAPQQNNSSQNGFAMFDQNDMPF